MKKEQLPSAKKGRPLALRLLAGAGAVTLIVLLLGITNSFTGNPVSAFLAKQKLTAYVREAYPQYDLKADRARYNFKFGTYDVTFQDTQSQDVKFTASLRRGGDISDDYDSQVTGRTSTLIRLADEMSGQLRPVVETFLRARGLQVGQRLFADFSLKQGTVEIPPLNTPYSRELPLEGTLFVDIQSESSMTLQQEAAVIRSLHERVTGEGYRVVSYVLTFSYPMENRQRTDSISLDAVYIDENLAHTLQEVLDSDGFQEDIYVRLDER